MASGKQIRAGRVLADWDAEDLAAKTGLTRETIFNIERGTFRPRPATHEKIVKAFAEVGIEFIENEGVRRLPTSIEVFEGRERFEDFINNMYEYLERYGGEVCVYIQDEGLLRRTRKNIEAHRAKMTALVQAGKITGKILAAKGVEKSPWAEIRRVPLVSDMPRVSFHTFGDNLALISFDHTSPPYVVLHKFGPFTAVYKAAFDDMWTRARPPE